MTTALNKTYPNGETRILQASAVSATDNPEAVIVQTMDEGAVLVVQSADPDLWAQIIAAGLMPEA